MFPRCVLSRVGLWVCIGDSPLRDVARGCSVCLRLCLTIAIFMCWVHSLAPPLRFDVEIAPLPRLCVLQMLGLQHRLAVATSCCKCLGRFDVNIGHHHSHILR